MLQINSIVDQDQSCYLLCHSYWKSNKQIVVSFQSFPCALAQLFSKIIIISLSAFQNFMFKADHKKSPHGLLCLIVTNSGCKSQKKEYILLKKNPEHTKKSNQKKAHEEWNMLEFVWLFLMIWSSERSHWREVLDIQRTLEELSINFSVALLKTECKKKINHGCSKLT